MKSSLLCFLVLALTAKYDQIIAVCNLGMATVIGEEFSQCNGKFQSPINIETRKVRYSSSLGDIRFVNYEGVLAWNFTNTGQTVVASKAFDLSPEDSPAIYLNDNDDELFYLVQFHFHWGENINEGSEHRINNKVFPMEVHLVHNSTSGKLAVIGFLFAVSKQDNPRLNRLLHTIDNLQSEESFLVVKYRLKELIPDLEKSNRQGYFRYIGSLTTPPCTEGIIWTLYERLIPISARQIKFFDDTSVPANFRAIQRIFNRQVLSNNRKYLINQRRQYLD